jgi:hypothetical protein
MGITVNAGMHLKTYVSTINNRFKHWAKVLTVASPTLPLRWPHVRASMVT